MHFNIFVIVGEIDGTINDDSLSHVPFKSNIVPPKSICRSIKCRDTSVLDSKDSTMYFWLEVTSIEMVALVVVRE